jgi:hypothetical protein
MYRLWKSFALATISRHFVNLTPVDLLHGRCRRRRHRSGRSSWFLRRLHSCTLATITQKVSQSIDHTTTVRPPSQTYIQQPFRPLGQTFADAVAEGDAVRKVLRLHNYDTVQLAKAPTTQLDHHNSNDGR